MREVPGTCTEYPRSGCGPGASIPEPTSNERIATAEYARRLAQGLQMAADAAMELAVRAQASELRCRTCGGPVEIVIGYGGLLDTVCRYCADVHREMGA